MVVGRSQAFEQVLTLARQAAPTTATVMVTGETGTGRRFWLEPYTRAVCGVAVRSCD